MANTSTVHTKLIDAMYDRDRAIQYQAEAARQLAEEERLEQSLPPNERAALRGVLTAARDYTREAGRLRDGLEALVGALSAGAPAQATDDLVGRITDATLSFQRAKQNYEIAKGNTPAAGTPATGTPAAGTPAAATAAGTPVRQINTNKRERQEKELANLRKKNLTGYIPTQRNQVLFRIQQLEGMLSGLSKSNAKASPIGAAGPAGLPKRNCSWNDIKKEFFRSERVINANIGRISTTLGGLSGIGQRLYKTLSELRRNGTVLTIDECTKIIQLVNNYVKNLEDEVDRLGGKHDEVEGFVRELDLVTRGIVNHSIRSGGAYPSQIQAGSVAPPPVQSSSADLALYSLKQLTQQINANMQYPNIRTINTLIGYLSTYVDDPRFNTDANYRKIVFMDKIVQRAIAFIFRQILITKKFPLRSGVKRTVMPSDLNRFSAKGDFLSVSGLEFTPFNKLSFDDKMNLPGLLTALAPFPQATGGSRRTKAKRSRSKKQNRTRR